MGDTDDDLGCMPWDSETDKWHNLQPISSLSAIVQATALEVPATCVIHTDTVSMAYLSKMTETLEP